MSDLKIPQDKLNELLAICEEHGNQPGELINILHKAQHLFGYLPAEVQKIVAQQLQIPVSRVYGVVTFYSFFTMTPKGEHPISVCMGTACYVRGAEKVLDEFKRQLNVACAVIFRPTYRQRICDIHKTAKLDIKSVLFAQIKSTYVVAHRVCDTLAL